MTDFFTGSIQAGAPAACAAPTRDAAPASDSSAFQALLERLQQFTAPLPKAAADAPAVSPADELQQALTRADQSFTTAMDLRRQLEAAFHRQS